MDKVLKFFQILNQVVWIAVGLASLYSIYWFITSNPLEGILKNFNPQQNLQQNPQVQKLMEQYLQPSR